MENSDTGITRRHGWTRLNPVPQPVEWLLEKVNSFPPGFDLDEHLRAVRWKTDSEVMAAITAQLPLRQFPVFHDFVGTKKAQKRKQAPVRLYAVASSSQQLEEIRLDGKYWLRCRQLADARRLLRSIARAYKQARTISAEGDPKYATRMSMILSWPEHWIRTDVFPSVDADGQIRFSTLFNEIRGAEAARLRACEICGKILWAGRASKKCCDLRCLRVFHTRKSRVNRERQIQYEIARGKKEAWQKKLSRR
jgi:hypothetical protein